MIPEIINIIEIKDYKMTVYYNTSECRIIDFESIINNPKSDFDKKLKNKEIFHSVFVSDGNLLFKKLKFSYQLNRKRKFAYYSIGGDTLYDDSLQVDINLPIGTKIKNLRLQYNITQKQLSEKIKITAGNLSEIERNLHYPQIKTLNKIAKFFGKEIKIDFAN